MREELSLAFYFTSFIEDRWEHFERFLPNCSEIELTESLCNPAKLEPFVLIHSAMTLVLYKLAKP